MVGLPYETGTISSKEKLRGYSIVIPVNIFQNYFKRKKLLEKLMTINCLLSNVEQSTNINSF